MKKNLWILTEESPKREVVRIIINKFMTDSKITGFIDTVRILPILTDERDFSFTYEVLGVTSNKFNQIFIKIVSGKSSFVDYLVFFQEKLPSDNDTPIYAIEETKTDDGESRNTGIFQRASKFVFIDIFYPDNKIIKIMLYNLKIKQKEKQTETNIFGTRCLLTLGVEILGKEVDKKINIPFINLDELINYKNSMRNPPKGNIPIKIEKSRKNIKISGRLFKSGSLSHDPNIGALSLISATIRKLCWKNKIIITEHGLKQKHIDANSKFLIIASKLNIEFETLTFNKSIVSIDSLYWYYESKGEKLATIFIDIIVESFTYGYSIFDNHAGCEKGYFLNSCGDVIPLKKYIDREKYKKGDKSQIIHIPDLILIDIESKKIINIEGKTYSNRNKGIKELDNFDAIENLYITPNYPKFKIIRKVVLFGSEETKLYEIEVGFLLNENGKMILGIKAPKLFKDAIKNLIDFYQ